MREVLGDVYAKAESAVTASLADWTISGILEGVQVVTGQEKAT